MEDEKPRDTGAAYAFAPFRLVPDECLLLREGKPVALTPQAFDLLRLLVEAAGHLKTRDELIEALWPATVVEETNLSWNVRAVRKALGDDSEAPRYIETVHGRGYRFIAPVEVEGVGEPAEEGQQSEAGGRRRRLWITAASGAAVVVAVAIALVILWPWFSGGSRAPATAHQRPAVAVLGFQNLSGDSQAGWVGAALAEMVGTDLAIGGALRTVPATDVARLRREFNLPAGGAALNGAMRHALRVNLGVRYVATGAYLVLGQGKSEQLRVDAKLIDTGNGDTVVALSETGSRDQLFALVRSLGVGLREHLGVAALNSAEQSEVRATIPASPAAARAYAEGLQALAAGDPVGARKALEQAVADEPDFPLAYVDLAQTWMDLGDEVNARAAAQKALANSAGLARPQRLLIDGLFREAGHEWDQAVEDYRALFEFYPDNLQYGLLLARAQVKAGKPKDALATVRRMRKLPPPVGNDPRVDLAEADAADTLGDNKRAAVATLRAVATARDRGATLLQARALSAQGRSDDMLGKYADALARLGEARALYEKVGGDALDFGIALERIGNAYGAKGDYDAAIKAFEQANETFARVGNSYWQGAALNNIGNIYYRRNRLDDALHYYRLALPQFRVIHRDLTASYVLNNLAVILGYQGDMAGAIENYEKALAIRRAAGATALASDVLLNLGIDYTATGALKKARKSLEEAMAIYKKNDDTPDVSNVLAAIADIDVQENKLQAAQAHYERALAIRKTKGMHNEMAENERDLAELALLTGKPAEAARLAQSAVTEYHKEKAGTDEAHARAVLGLALLAQDHPRLAQTQWQLAQALYSKVENRRAKLNLDILFSQLKAGLGDRDAAEKALQNAGDQARHLGLLTLAYWARFRLIETQTLAGTNAGVQEAARELATDAARAGYLLVARKATALASPHA